MLSAVHSSFLGSVSNNHSGRVRILHITTGIGRDSATDVARFENLKRGVGRCYVLEKHTNACLASHPVQLTNSLTCAEETEVAVPANARTS